MYVFQDLAEPSRKLAEEAGKDKEADIDDDFDPSKLVFKMVKWFLSFLCCSEKYQNIFKGIYIF